MADIKKTLENLKKNNIDAYYVETAAEAKALVKSLLKKGETVSCGGSITLAESGVKELISGGDYVFLNRDKAETLKEKEEIYRKSFFADTYLTSANALTENGELINVDGNSNRVAAIAFGPKNVICVVGINKLVKDSEEGFLRVKKEAAPKNAKRLNCNTPCAKTGVCCAVDKPLGAGCLSPERICCNYIVTSYQRIKGRIKVIICGEELGY